MNSEHVRHAKLVAFTLFALRAAQLRGAKNKSINSP
jgi:hypothetical protein